MLKMKKYGYGVNFSEDRFLELSTNPQTRQYNENQYSKQKGV